MDRISTSMISSTALADLSRAQRDVATYGRQSASQLKSNELKGYGYEAQTLVSADRMAARTDAFLNIASELTTRMEIQDVALSQAGKAISSLREDLFQNVALNSGVGIMQRLDDVFSTLRQTMNTKLAGRYVFGGMLNDRPPFLAENVSDLVGTPVADALQQGAVVQTVRVEEWRTVEAGPLATDVVTQALGSIKAIAELNDADPLDGVLSATQLSALETELANLEDAFQGALAVQVNAGRQLAEVEATEKRLISQKNVLNEAIGGIVQVDLAEVAVKLNQSRFAYETSASIFSMVRELSLLNFLN